MLNFERFRSKKNHNKIREIVIKIFMYSYFLLFFAVEIRIKLNSGYLSLSIFGSITYLHQVLFFAEKVVGFFESGDYSSEKSDTTAKTDGFVKLMDSNRYRIKVNDNNMTRYLTKLLVLSPTTLL